MIELKQSKGRLPYIELEDCPEEIHRLIRNTITNQYMDTEEYRVSQNSGAFLQGGSNLEGGWIFVEFWKPKGAHEFVEYINKKIGENL
jgi:hypothetical protein